MIEDAVVHEFSALGLSQMAIEFSSKAAIFENNGIEPLVKCLNSSDPDVQKNAIEIKSNILNDMTKISTFMLTLYVTFPQPENVINSIEIKI